ncbi:unnamed protein product [Mycena citricolor]|uniref:Major facilitator superfamily (MFS) profile domain-containing protein n=1 Tax=Mycena citricolor TaxID=2018698 RepID=A0AAD2H862_9AGAR|nr:unnamed protein product [Mycena citricolor]
MSSLAAAAERPASTSSASETTTNLAGDLDLEARFKDGKDRVGEKSDAQETPAPMPETLAADDPENPRNWSTASKVTATLVICLWVLTLTYSSTAYVASIPSLMKRFGISEEVALLGVSLTVLGFAAGPLIFGPASELYGRQAVYRFTAVFYSAFLFGAAFAPSAAGLLIFRFLSGFFGSASINNGPASIGDWTSPSNRGAYTALYGLMAFGGPCLGPLVANFIQSDANYHWNLRVIAIFGTFIGLLVALVPETHGPTLLRWKLRRQGQETPALTVAKIVATYKVALARPVLYLVTGKRPIFSPSCRIVLYGILYGFFETFSVVYVEIRGFKTTSYGLTYISLGLGFVVSAILLATVGQYDYHKAAKKAAAKGLPMEPEVRLTLTCWGAVASPISLFIFAWTAPYPRVHWIACCIAEFIFAWSTFLIFNCFIPYMIDCYQMTAASALAAGMASRALVASVFPLFSLQMYHNLTVQGATSLLGGIAVLMWAKFSSALKSKAAPAESASLTPNPTAHLNPAGSHGEVMSSVFEQHPNLSVFRSADRGEPNPSPPPSPSRSGRMNVFKRHEEHQRAPSPMKGLSKKVKSTFGVHGNNSQLSLGPSSPIPPPESSSTRRSSFNLLKRPSIEALRSPTGESFRSLSRADESRFLAEYEQQRPTTPATAFENKSGSVRSILREKNTPGTGQNVRFFSRDAYRVLSPEQSMESDSNQDFQSMARPTSPIAPASQRSAVSPVPTDGAFMERLKRAGSDDSNASSSSMPRIGSTSKLVKKRPALGELFSPTASPETNAPRSPAAQDSSRSLSQMPPGSEFSNLFDVSQELELDLPVIPPPGLGFDLDSMMGSAPKPMTSTPFRDKGKGKEELRIETSVDENIFHAKDKAPQLPAVLHERTNSFSAGQTMFYSIAHDDESSKRTSTSSDFPSSAQSSPAKDEGSVTSPAESSSPVAAGRPRALSDTVFMSMLRSPSPKSLPEADINDESSAELVVYNSEPDPFSANANTYYTPQTNIPPTPPPAVSHSRTGSKENDTIISLKTQLALQTELCGQYETDLAARDELVDLLRKKLDDVDREEKKRSNVLKSWKKKVVELERACRLLEEEVEGSRHESMERSIMDEASSEALRMLHKQISKLERECDEQKRIQAVVREENGLLEVRLREKSEEANRLKEDLWSRDEKERQLERDMNAMSEQVNMLSNVSIAIDETELRKIAAGPGFVVDGDEERQHRSRELQWDQEREELVAAAETAKLEKADAESELDNCKQQLGEQAEQMAMLKIELEAQWEHTEKAADKLELVQQEAEREKDELHAELVEFEDRVLTLEAELTESESKQIELDNEVQALWDEKEARDKEFEEIAEQIHNKEAEIEALQNTLKSGEDRIVELTQERQYALDNVTRLEENIRRRDAEVTEYSQRVLEHESEAESLREQMSRLKREHATALESALAERATENDEQARVARDRVNDFKDEVERLRRQIHELQQESADKEVKLAQMGKQHKQDKEDLQGMNIALDSKQQELELMKRKMGVRGTAGSTPAQKTSQQRRDSTVFNATPSVGSRPPSVLSDAGSDRGSSTGKLPALTRLSNKPPVTRGSMGPPPARPSVSGTPTPASSLSRSMSAKPALSSTPVAAQHRRVVSATLDQSMTRKRQSMTPGEKENVSVSRPGTKARVPVPS